MNVLIELHGYVSSNEHTNEPLETVATALLDELAEELSSPGAVETIVTGVHQEVTYGLQDAVAEHPAFDAEVDPHYRRVTDYMDGTKDDIDDWFKAKAEAFSNRDACVMLDKYDPFPTVDAAVIGRGRSNSGEWNLQNARKHGVPVLDLSLEEFIEPNNSEVSTPFDDLVEISGVGETRAEALKDAGFSEPDELLVADEEDIQDADGFGEATARELRSNVLEAAS